MVNPSPFSGRAFHGSCSRRTNPENRSSVPNRVVPNRVATLPQIGKTLGVGSTGASYLIRRARQLTDSRFREMLEKPRLTIRNCRPQT